MSRWFSLTPTDDAFFSSAPVRTTKVLDTAVSVERLWEAITADDALVSWSPGVTKVSWLTPRPFGVGTRREVTIAGLATVREHFYRWEEGSRKSFYVPESNRPGISRFAEDYVVEATASGSRLTWIVAVEPKGPAFLAKLAAPVVSLAIGSAAHGLGRKLAG